MHFGSECLASKLWPIIGKITCSSFSFSGIWLNFVRMSSDNLYQSFLICFASAGLTASPGFGNNDLNVPMNPSAYRTNFSKSGVMATDGARLSNSAFNVFHTF